MAGLLAHSILVGRVVLNTEKRVYLEPDNYRIESVDRRGRLHGSYVPIEAVAFGRSEWIGDALDVAEAVARIAPHAEKLKLPYTYGHKLQFAVQDILVALAAEGIAEVRREGRKFLYQIGGGELTVYNAGTAAASPTDLRERILAGENQRLEFKSSASYDYHRQQHDRSRMLDVLRTLVGFLNCEGGTLLVGVTDSGEIVGLANDYDAKDALLARDRWILKVRNAIQEHIGHEQWNNIRAEIVPCDNHEIAVLEVSSASKPAFLKVKGQEVFYVRAMNSTQQMPTGAAVEYIRERFG